MRRTRGFTLVELLVAVAIVALIAAFGYAGLDQLVRQREQHRATAARLAELQRALLVVERDLAAAEARPAREPSLGSPEAAVRGGASDGWLVQFTRNGYRNPLLEPRSSLQRVGYRIEDRRLVRYAWRGTEPGPDAQPERRVLLERVDSATLRYLDPRGAWRDDWPPLDAGPGVHMPRAFELTLVVDDQGGVQRLIELPEPQ